MQIYSWNVNGLRACYKHGFLKWFNKVQPDIVCLQEIKADKEQLSEELLNIPGYQVYFNSAQKKGYAGVAIYTKLKHKKLDFKLGLERFDQEGRSLFFKFKDFYLLNLYLPHGGRMKENLKYKLKVYSKLLDCIKKYKDKKFILLGDLNIAHTEKDLARPKENVNNIMFTPEERKQLDKVIKLGYIDSFRKFCKTNGHYTWWAYAFNARERNMGWRIDYAFISSPLSSDLKQAQILKKVLGSDHCPIKLELKY